LKTSSLSRKSSSSHEKHEKEEESEEEVEEEEEEEEEDSASVSSSSSGSSSSSSFLENESIEMQKLSRTRRFSSQISAALVGFASGGLVTLTLFLVLQRRTRKPQENASYLKV